MNKQLFLCKKSVIGVLLLAMASVTAIAQSIQIKQGTNTVSGYYCMPVNDPGTSFTVEGVSLSTDPKVTATIVNTTWTTLGGIQKQSESGTTVSVIPKTGTDYATQYSKYAKGKITAKCRVKYKYDYTPIDCGGDSLAKDTFVYYIDYTTEVEIRKVFDMPDGLTTNAIVGPVCVSPGDSVTYSVAPWVSLYQMNQVGFDSYYWTIPQGLSASDLYYSADSSSVTFTAGTDIAGKTLSVKMGKCNTTQTPLTFTLGQEPADPIFEGKDLNSYCLPFGTLSDTIIISNPQPGATYTWDFRSWTIDKKSQKGDTIIYTPLNNAQTITLKMSGGCTDKQFIYDINRSITPTDSIKTDYGYCLPANADLVFYLKNVPDGTEMEWKVLSGTGWNIDDNQKNKARPTIHVGTGTGVVSAKTSKCTNDSVTFTFNIKPEQPGVITGETCLQTGVTSALSYSVTPVLNATNGYQWSYPNGWSVNGTDSISASISLIPNGTNGGDIQVRAIGCDASAWSNVKAVRLTPDKPDAFLVNTCVDAGLPGTITVKVNDPIISSDVTYHWSILDSNLGTISSYTNTNDPSERIINTTGNTGSFLVTVYASSTSCGAGILDTVVVNVNKDDFTQTVREEYDFLSDKSQYKLNLTSSDVPWVNNHYISWYLEGYGDATLSETQPYYSKTDLPANLMSSTDPSFYITVTNKTTGCKTRKTSGVSGLRAKQNISATNNTEKTVKKGDMILSPNPTDSFLNVVLPDNSLSDIAIYNLSGKEVKRLSNLEDSAIEINVSDLPQGNYILYAVQNGEVYAKKFVKK